MTNMNVSDLLRHYKDVDLDQSQIEPMVDEEEAQRLAGYDTTRVEVSMDLAITLSRLSKKAIKVANAFVNRGVDVDRLRSGVNPFQDGKPKFMDIACAALLKGGISKAGLVGIFMQRLSVDRRTAESYVSIAFSVFQGFGVIVAKDNLYFIAD